jgi:hypothetical protein
MGSRAGAWRSALVCGSGGAGRRTSTSGCRSSAAAGAPDRDLRLGKVLVELLGLEGDVDDDAVAGIVADRVRVRVADVARVIARDIDANVLRLEG